MRILIGFVAVMVWIMFCVSVMAEFGITIPNETQFLTIAIVFAGAMAGGDGK